VRGNSSISQTFSATIASQGRIDALDQDRGRKGLIEEDLGAGLRGPGSYILAGEGRDKDKRDVIAPASDDLQKVQTAHSWHLYIRNDTGRVLQAG
jgi:hypothetical protein